MTDNNQNIKKRKMMQASGKYIIVEPIVDNKSTIITSEETRKAKVLSKGEKVSINIQVGDVIFTSFDILNSYQKIENNYYVTEDQVIGYL